VKIKDVLFLHLSHMLGFSGCSQCFLLQLEPFGFTVSILKFDINKQALIAELLSNGAEMWRAESRERPARSLNISREMLINSLHAVK
jgi:hypothetical protein